MNRYQAIKAAQAQAQKKRLGELALRVEEEAALRGINVSFFGSYPEDRVHQHSDLDIAILADDDASDFIDFCTFIDRTASKIGVEVDVVIRRPDAAEV